MDKTRRAYLAGAMGTAAARGLSLVAGVASLWLLTRVLSEQDFAAYMVAMSLVTILGYLAGLGLERTMLLSLPALDPGPGRLVGRTLALHTSGVVAVFATTVAVLLYLGAEHLESDGSSVSASWIRALLPVVPATAVSLTLVTWFQANHRVALSQVTQGLSDAFRAAFFGFVLLLGLGTASVALGAVLAACLPIAILVVAAIGRSERDALTLSLRDVAPGAQFLAIRLSYFALRHFDVVLLGLLSSAAETAGYVVASRLAAIVGLAQDLFAQTYLPRSRRHAAMANERAVAREYATARVLAFALALAASTFFVATGPVLLAWFGDFGSAYGAMLVLMAGYLSNAGAGTHEEHLSMAGLLGWSTALRLASTAVFISAALIWIPDHGALGVAFAFLLAAVTADLIGAVLLRRLTGINILAPQVLLPTLASVAILTIGPRTLGSPAMLSALLAAVLVYLLVSERRVVAAVLRRPRATG